jgi:hypothetical protein
VIDAVSWRILLEDLHQAYHQLSQSQAIALPIKSSSYKQWIEKLKHYTTSPCLATERDYWRTLTTTGTNVPLPKTRTAQNYQTWTFELSSALTDALLHKAPQAYRTQINDLLLTALALTLHSQTGNPTLMVALEGHGREDIFEDIDLSRTLGWFTTLFPVRLELPASAAFDQIIKHIKEQLRAIPQKGIGYGILRYLSPYAAEFAGDMDTAISFNYLGQTDRGLSANNPFTLATEPIGPLIAADSRKSHPWEINCAITQGKLSIRWDYDRAIYAK